jgi:hypothetical protein
VEPKGGSDVGKAGWNGVGRGRVATSGVGRAKLGWMLCGYCRGDGGGSWNAMEA